MLRGKLLSKGGATAVRALVAAGAAERRCSTNLGHENGNWRRRFYCGASVVGITSTCIAEHGERSSSGGHHVQTSCCGFPKHMLNGPSTVLDRGVFGDDACFIARFKGTHVAGVADGVGGWRNYGVDPSEFSSRLMKICSAYVEAGKFDPERPDKLLAEAFEELAEPPRPVGSSTACVLVIDQGTLYAANLGDSGFLVIRSGKIIYRSREQTHYFNAPFQLSLPPTNAASDGFLHDSPEKAELISLNLLSGDVVVLATDGVWDNVPDNIITDQLKELKPGNVQQACNTLALTARRLAFDTQQMSPFAMKASQHGMDMPGGKPDDITLILLLIV